MLYQINGDYYVKVGNKYVKLLASLDKKGELVLQPTKIKLENNKSLRIKTIDLSKEKDKIVRSLKIKSYSDEDSLK